MTYMHEYYYSTLPELNLNNFNTNHVTDMNGMLMDCSLS